MKLISVFLLVVALALPASASTINSWTQADIAGHNLTLNYTSSFNVVKNDTLGITIKNVGDVSLNDTVTINEINVSDTSSSKAEGRWTGNVTIEPGSSETIGFILNVTADDAVTVDISIHYNVSSDYKTLVVTAHYPGTSRTPAITSWGNSKTGNNDLTITVNTSEVVRFNFTADQILTSWQWSLNGNSLTNPSNTLTYTFNNAGSYKVGANGSNANGTTQTVVWSVNVKGIVEEKKKNASVLSWSPQVVDYIYVNDTVEETVEYSLTTVEPMTVSNWSVDGVPVDGDVSGTTYSYTHTWDNDSVGFHTVIYKGSNAGSRIEFRWYVNVYEIGGYRGGNLFDVIDDALENHVTDIKIRMFKYRIAKNGGKSEIAAQKVNQLHDEIAKRQMTREALREEFKAGNITSGQYAAALKQVQKDAKYNMKLAKDLAKISKEELKDENTSEQFEKISEMENEKGKDETKVDAKGKGKKDKDKNKGKGNRKK